MSNPMQGTANAKSVLDWRNVTNYGADPTGTNDSTTAFSDFTTAVGADGVGVIPSGTYKVTSMATFESTATYIFAPGAILLLNGTPQQRLSYYHPQGEPYNVLRETFASGSDASTTGSMDAGSKTLTLDAVLANSADGQGIAVQGAGAATSLSTPTMPSITWNGTTGSTTWAYTIAAVDSLQGVTAAPTSASVTDGAATLTGANYPSFTLPDTAGVTAFAVYRTTAGTTPSTTGYLGVWAPGNKFEDFALATVTPPDGIPSTAPTTATAQYLLTQIVSGGGTTSLTLLDAATTKVSGVFAYHDDHAALASFFSKLDSTASSGEIPARTYNVFQPLTSNGDMAGFIGGGLGGSFDSTVIQAGIAMAQVMTIGPSSPFTYGIYARGVRFIGNNYTVTSALTLKNISWSYFDSVWATNSARDGLLVTGCVTLWVSHGVYSNYGGHYGVNVTDTNLLILDSCVAGSNGRVGISLAGSIGCVLRGCDVEGNGTLHNSTSMGIFVQPPTCDRISIEDCWLEQNKGVCTIGFGGVRGVSVIRCNIGTFSADCYGQDFEQGLYGNNDRIFIDQCRFFGDISGGYIIDDATSYAPTVVIGPNNHSISGGPLLLSTAPGPQTAPSIPAASTTLQNPFEFDCQVTVSGGTEVNIGIGRTSTTAATGLSSGSVIVRRSAYISLGAYTAAPTWTWIGV